MNWAPEDELLISCCSVKVGEAAMHAARRVLQKPLDWAGVVETSIVHAVSPLLYYGLNQVLQLEPQNRAIPSGVLEELQQLFRANQVRSRRMYRVVGEIFKAFKSAGLAAMALKDIQLARVIYPDPGLRPMGDIDILIRQEQYQDVAKCMTQLGFTARPPDLHFTLKYGLGHHFYRPTDNVWVDLQWNIMQREWDVYHEGNFDFQIDQMWGAATTMSVDDFEMMVPKQEDMLFHLCLHLEGHKYSELILFCDIAEFLRHFNHQLDWHYLIELTKKYRAESSVYYVLFLVQQLFGSPLPLSLLNELEPTHFKANLFDPLFENLGALHKSLGEIRRFTAPPAQTMNRFEEVARRQTVGAMYTYKVLDDIASAFVNSGGGSIILEGSPSEKIIPDPALRPFQSIDLFIIQEELSHMRQLLADYGFHANGTQASEEYVKESMVGSVAPILTNRPSALNLQVEVCRGLIFPLKIADTPSKREIAFKAIRNNMHGGGDAASKLVVRVRVVAVTPEALLLYLSVRLGIQCRDRLFGLCSLLEFFRTYEGSIDWQQVIRAAEYQALKNELCQGLLLVSGFLAPDRIPADVLSTLKSSAPAPRALESARYDPDSYGRYTNFKAAFFYLFTILSTAGAGSQLKYLLRTLVGWGSPPVVPRLISEVVKSLLASFQNKRRTAKDFAFWLDSDPALRITDAVTLKQPETNSAGELV